MKTTRCLFLIWSLFIFSFLNSQGQNVEFADLETEQTKTAAISGQINQANSIGKVIPGNDRVKTWKISYEYLGKRHGVATGLSDIDSIKQVLNARKQLSSYKDKEKKTQKTKSINPILSQDFRGNGYSRLVPPDNNLAVSDSGMIISVTNTNLLFANKDGEVFLEQTFEDFFDEFDLAGFYFDPRVIYDPTEDKFIMVVLNGNTPQQTNLIVAYSNTGNPNDAWSSYLYDGDYQNPGSWLDYPTIGISEEDLYICGNLFDDDNKFVKSVIFQIEKKNGFSGGQTDFRFWDDIRTAAGYREGTVVPVSYGFDGALSPGIFFVSSNPRGGDEIRLYWTTESMRNNPRLQGERLKCTRILAARRWIAKRTLRSDEHE